jgi:hypothetical protein
LPDQTYAHLKAEAERMQVPATVWRVTPSTVGSGNNSEAPRETRSAYAAEMAGTGVDFDSDLELAAIEHLLKTGPAPRSSG